jgi:hypothetical protein
MKFKEFLDNLNKYAKENPESLELDVITSKDDEGNGYNMVYYTPSKGIFEDREFIPKDQLQEWGRDEDDINAICVN